MMGTGCALVATLGVAACGSSSSSSSSSSGASAASSGGKTIDIYSSLPLQGASMVQSDAVVDGAKLALQQVGGKVNGLNVKYISLDDSTAAAGKWDPGQTSTDAKQAASDSNAIAYIGEYNSGASAISIPITNRIPLLQVSPANTEVGLTADIPGAVSPGEPAKYYPTGKRTYGRIVPKDTIQAAADVTLMKGDGCKSVYILNDREVYGAGLATNIETAAKADGLKIDGNQGIDPKAPNYRSQASQIHSPCFIFAGIDNNNGVQVYKDVSAADPTAKLYGPDGVTDATFVDPKQGGISAAIAKKIQITVATLDPKAYPPSGQAFFKQFESTYNIANPSPYAIYGYEAMAVVLDSIKRSGITGPGASERQAVINAFFQTKNRKSVLGTYSIDKNGDTTLTAYGVYRIVNGNLVFEKEIKAKAAA
jgi:branched-chain amino acid transport system substrate-binding protein